MKVTFGNTAKGRNRNTEFRLRQRKQSEIWLRFVSYENRRKKDLPSFWQQVDGVSLRKESNLPPVFPTNIYENLVFFDLSWIFNYFVSHVMRSLFCCICLSGTARLGKERARLCDFSQFLSLCSRNLSYGKSRKYWEFCQIMQIYF